MKKYLKSLIAICLAVCLISGLGLFAPGGNLHANELDESAPAVEEAPPVEIVLPPVQEVVVTEPAPVVAEPEPVVAEPAPVVTEPAPVVAEPVQEVITEPVQVTEAQIPEEQTEATEVATEATEVITEAAEVVTEATEATTETVVETTEAPEPQVRSVSLQQIVLTEGEPALGSVIRFLATVDAEAGAEVSYSWSFTSDGTNWKPINCNTDYYDVTLSQDNASLYYKVEVGAASAKTSATLMALYPAAYIEPVQEPEVPAEEIAAEELEAPAVEAVEVEEPVIDDVEVEEIETEEIEEPTEDATITSAQLEMILPEEGVSYGSLIRLQVTTDASENADVSYIWQYSLDGENWVNFECTADHYEYVLDEINAQYYWRVIADI